MGQLTTVKNESLATAKTQLDGAKEKYSDAGATFITNITNALEDMKGDTKDSITEFIENTIKPFVTESVPSAIESSSKLLEGNREAFEKMDEELAKALRSK